MHEAKEVSTKNEAGAILKGMMVRHETCKRSQSKNREINRLHGEPPSCPQPKSRKKKMEPVSIFTEQRSHREGEAAAQQTCSQRRV